MAKPSAAPKPPDKPGKDAKLALPVALGLCAAALLGKLLRRGGSARDAPAVEEPMQPVTLAWQGVRCSLESKDKPPRALLQGVSGVAAPGRLLGLLGPSGAGKTTLLNALAGALPLQKGMLLSGDLTLNGATPTPGGEPRGRVQGYVRQEDSLFSQLTVLETLRLAASLRLPAGLAEEAKLAAAQRLVAQLGLTGCAHTRVARCSGGERKRLCLAAELIASPALLFLDEPTSGLDAFAAQSVVRQLSSLAKRGHTVVASLHQPRGSVFALLDDLVLLAEGGRPLYVGPASAAVAHFERALGQARPADSTPAEWLSDLAAVDTSSPEAAAASRRRIEDLVAHWRATEVAASAPEPQAPSVAIVKRCAPQLSWHAQFRLLLGRAWRQVTRDKATLMSRLGSSVFSALLFSNIYWRLPRSQAALLSRVGLLQVSCINAAMGSLIKTLSVFPKERTIVSQERAVNAYGVAPYFAAKLAAELPIGAVFPLIFGAIVYPAAGLTSGVGRIARFMGVLTLESFASSALGMAIGAAVPSTQAALAVGPAVMVLFIVFGGLYTSSETVPFFLRWVPKASLIKQAFEGLVVNELRGATFVATAPGDAATGEQALRRMGFERSTVRGTAAAQMRILLTYWGASYLVLLRRKPRFAAMKPRPTART